MSTHYTNKVVWITGATSGIGEALTYQLVSEGAKVVISARREEELQRVKTSSSNPSNVLVVPLDLTASETFNTKAQEVFQHFGRIDVLINNGGVSQRSNVMDTSLEVDRRIMEVNFFGNIAMAKAVLPYMVKEKSGHFILLSSLAGKFGFFQRSSYSASKHALHGYYESLRLEHLKDNIKVTLCCPGFVQTNMAQNALTGSGEKHANNDAYQDNGITAKSCAQQILKAAEKGKEEVLIGRKELQAVYVKRFFPRLLTKILSKQSPTGNEE